jgi:hypothetical protein
VTCLHFGDETSTPHFELTVRERQDEALAPCEVLDVKCGDPLGKDSARHATFGMSHHDSSAHFHDLEHRACAHGSSCRRSRKAPDPKRLSNCQTGGNDGDRRGGE